MVLLNLLVKPGWLFTEMLLQNRVGHEAWGRYAALTALAMSLTVLTDFGVNQYTTKSLAADAGKFKAWFPDLLGFKAVLLFIYPIVLIGAGAGLGYSWKELGWLTLIAFSWSIMQWVQFLRTSYQAFQHLKIDGWASVTDKIVLILFSIGFLISGSAELSPFLYLLALSSIITLFIFMGITLRTYGKLRLQFNWVFIKRILKLSFPFALISIVYAVHDKIDKIMIDGIRGAEQTGLYSAASRWIDALMMYIWIIMGIYYARFARNFRDKIQQAKLLEAGQLLGALPMILAMGILLFFGEEITSRVFTKSSSFEIQEIQASLNWLAAATLINSTFVIYSTQLTAIGYEGPVTRMVGLSILFKIIFNFILIPYLGAEAAAMATFITYVLLAAGYVALSHTKTKVQIPYPQLLRLLLLTVLFIPALGICKYFLRAEIAMGLGIFIYLGLGSLLGLISISKIKGLLQ